VKAFINYYGVKFSQSSKKLWDEEEIIIFRGAIRRGHESVVRLLIDHGARLKSTRFHIKDDHQYRGFFHGVFTSPLSEAIRCGREAVVKVTIDNGASLSIKHQDSGQDPLSLATRHSHVSIVKLLLDYGCNPCPPDTDVQNNHTTPAWMIAASMNIEILQVFMVKGFKLTFPGHS
jgi:ankyrin repeat protein